MTLLISFFVIVLVAALVGRVVSRSRPGHHPRSSTDGASWPGASGGVTADDGSARHVQLPDTGSPHAPSGHSQSHSHGHGDGGGGWGGDSGSGGSGGDGGGSSGGDSGGGGGGD
ncbi:MAG: hypothetical protein ACRYF3_08420 [Janthinobacterium lividum]